MFGKTVGRRIFDPTRKKWARGWIKLHKEKI
jgi:hypothetical protein